MLAEDVLHVLDGLAGQQGLAGLLVVEHGDGDAPGALPTDAPFRSAAHKGGDSILADAWNPLDALDRLEGIVPERLHACEPLIGGAEDRRLLRAPVVRVLVLVRLHAQERAGAVGDLDALVVSVANDAEAGQREALEQALLGFAREPPCVVHRAERLQVVLQASEVVLLAVARRCVHHPRPRFGGNVVATGHNRAFSVDEGMRVADLPTDLRTQQGMLDGKPLVHANRLGKRGHKIRGAQHMRRGVLSLLDAGGFLPTVGQLHHRILQLLVHRHGHVRRQGPGRGGPDAHPELVPVGHERLQGRGQRLRVFHGERRVDRLALVPLGVLQLRFGQRRATGRTPVHGLSAAVDVALLHHVAEDADLGRLVLRLEREVRVFPVPPHAVAHEGLLLPPHRLDSKVPRFLAQLRRREVLLLVLLQSLQHLELDRQAVAVPPGDVADLAALQGVELVDDVLQNLVQRVADVQVAVGVGRAIMQREGLSRRLLPQLLVDALLLPIRLDLRLSLDGVRALAKARLRQNHRILVALLFHHSFGNRAAEDRGRARAGHARSQAPAEAERGSCEEHGPQKPPLREQHLGLLRLSTAAPKIKGTARHRTAPLSRTRSASRARAPRCEIESAARSRSRG
eukprot:scaffold3100_cov248-Pinguiococcus_pyrenoidosus.AAC.18